MSRLVSGRDSALIRALHERYVEVSARQLRSWRGWRQVGLIPRAHKRVRGFHPISAIPLDEIKWVEEAAWWVENLLRLDLVGIVLAARGYPLNAGHVKGAYIAELEPPHKDLYRRFTSRHAVQLRRAAGLRLRDLPIASPTALSDTIDNARAEAGLLPQEPFEFPPWFERGRYDPRTETWRIDPRTTLEQLSTRFAEAQSRLAAMVQKVPPDTLVEALQECAKMLVPPLDDWYEQAFCLIFVLFYFPGPFLIAAHADQDPATGVEAAFVAVMDAYDWPMSVPTTSASETS
jgi:hypothetical protein